MKKRILCMLLAIVMVVGLVPGFAVTASAAGTADVWDGTTAAQAWESGSGTEDNPYVIMTAAQLAKLAADVNGGINYSNTYFKLGADLDLSGSSKNWTPIGGYHSKSGSSASNAFAGVFDGDNHTIFNMHSDGPTSNYDYAGYRGLFGNLSGMLKNLILSAPQVSGRKSYFGAAVAYADGATISNITVNNSHFAHTGTAGYNGGVVGYIANGIVENCHVVGGDVTAIYSSDCLGGIIGYATDVKISGCSVKNTAISADSSFVGGIVGQIKYADGTNSITNCTVENSTISGTSSGVGGIVGYGYGKSAGKITVKLCSVTSGSVTADYYAGGIMGQSFWADIIGCCNYGSSVTATSSIGCAGGILGYSNSGNCYSCFSSASVTAKQDAGAIIAEDKMYYYECAYDKTLYPSDLYFSNTKGFTTEEITAGAAAYHLANTGTRTQNFHDWGQKIGTDPYPVWNTNNDASIEVYREEEPSGYIYYNKGAEDVFEPNAQGYYEISDTDTWYKFARKAEEDHTVNAIVVAAIDFSSVTADKIADYRIGDDYEFAGIFNGNGKTIMGLPSTSDPLFGTIGSSGKLAGLTVNGITVSGGQYGSKGGLVQTNNGTIENCTISSVMVSGSMGAGLVYENKGTVTGCTAVNVDINTTTASAGLVYSNYGSIVNSKVESGTIKAIQTQQDNNDAWAGGICFITRGGTITGCTNGASVYAKSASDLASAAGIVAAPIKNDSNEVVHISNCANTGNIEADGGGGDYAGGISSIYVTGADVHISLSYNTGMITADVAAGIIAHVNDGSVTNCYNAGPVNARNTAGGISGTVCTITNSHNYAKVTSEYYAAPICATSPDSWPNGRLTNNYGIEGNIEALNVNTYYDTSSGVWAEAITTGSTKAQFVSGEIAYLLQQANGNTPVWSQGENYPVFVSDENPVIVKVDFYTVLDDSVSNQTLATVYVNAGQTFADRYPESADSRYKVEGYYSDSSCTQSINTSVFTTNADTILYAKLGNAHEHSWSYNANGATITATCANTDGHCPNTNGGSVTIHAPAGYTATTPLEYSGAEQKATLTGSFTTGDAFAADNAITITYNKTPINVGGYTASIEVDGAIASVTYSITQKDVTIKADDQTISYGESLTANDVTSDGLVAGHTVDSVTLNPSITDVGTGTITPSAAVIMNGTEDVTANYNISYAVGTLTINAASMTGVSAVGYTNAYDGNPHGITVTAPEGSTVTYSTDALAYNDANPTYTNVCEITVYYKVEKENYETVTGSAVVKITPLDISTAEVTLGDVLTYNGSEQTQNVAEVKVGNLIVDTDAYEVTDNTATNAGTEYELTVTAKENSNFTGSVKKSFSVAQKKVTVSAGTYKVSKSYDGTTNAGTASGVLAISGILDADSGVTVTATPEAYSNANVGGQSTVNVSLTLSGDTNNYVLESATLSVPCEITKKDIAIESADVSDKDYNGTEAAEVTAVTFKGVITGETLVIGTDYTVTSAVFPDANADAENQTVTISVTLTDSVKANNYNLTNGTGFAVVNAAKINKIDYPNTITADTTVRANKAQNDLTFDLTDKLNGIDGAAIKSVAYGSNDKNLLAGTPTGRDKTVTYHVNNGTAVGDTGVIEVTVSSTNYNDFVVAVTVTTTDKDTLTITGVKMDAEMYTYGGAAVGYDNSALSVTGTTGVAFDSNDLEYVYSGTLADGSTYAESTVAPTKAGTYTLTVRVPADNLDYTGKQEISFTIGAKKITRPAQASAVVYNGAEQTYGVASTTEYTVTGGVQKNANETGYDVTIALTDKFNTVWDNGTTDDLTHKFIINKKAITITADDKEAYAGSRQPELTYTVDGLIEGDKLTTEPTLTTDANMNRVGTYTITASGADAGSNYTISYVNGTLSVEMFYFPIITPRYDVEIADDITGGDVSANKTQAYKGDTITITVAPDVEYQLTALIVTDSRGNAVAVTKVSDTKYTFKMPGYDVVIDAAFAKIETPAPADPTVDCPRDWTCPMYGYTDLDRAAWYHDGVHFCIENNLMQGIGNNEFAPNGTTTRAMIVTILWRLEGCPIVNYAMDFEDVAADQWYTEAIRWAASEKIVEGYGNGKFGTNDAITREQMVTIMFRYAKYKGYDVSVGENTNILSYDDAFDVAEWAIPSMQWACGSGMIQGIADGNHMNLAPQGNATRAQAAAILQRYCENVANKD